MTNRNLIIYFILFAGLYLAYAVFVAGHGIHFTNLAVTAVALALAAYYRLKDRIKAN